MNKIRCTLLCCCLLLTAWSPAAAGQGTRAEAQDMVKKAAAAIRSMGREKAFALISDPKGPFVDRDLYVVVYDMQGTCLAHGQRASQMVGRNLMGMKDPEGRPYVRERIEQAKTVPAFWHDYRFTNPVTGKVEPKSMYVERHEDLLVSCGVYGN